MEFTILDKFLEIQIQMKNLRKKQKHKVKNLRIFG